MSDLPSAAARSSDRFDLAVFALTDEQEGNLKSTNFINEYGLPVLERPSFAEGSKTKYLVIREASRGEDPLRAQSSRDRCM